MRARLRPHLSFANVASALALFVALATGGAYATHLVVRGSDVVDESLTGADIRGRAAEGGQPAVDGTITGADLKSKSVKAGDLAQNSVNGGKVANDSLGGLDVNESALGTVPKAAKVGDVPGTELTGREIYWHVVAPSSETEVLADFGGLRITAACAKGAGLTLQASTTREHANIRAYTVGFFSSDIDNQHSHIDWSPVSGPKDLLINDGEHEIGRIAYWTWGGSVVTVEYLANDASGVDETVCSVQGHAFAS